MSLIQVRTARRAAGVELCGFMKAAAIAFVTGMFAGILYGLLGVHSPAPPLVGLTGLLGIVAGELAAQRSRSALHRRIDRGISDQRPSGA